MADRPAVSTTEIEVTPEMISVASDIMEESYLGDDRYGFTDEIFPRIFRAMMEEKSRAPSPRISIEDLGSCRRDL